MNYSKLGIAAVTLASSLIAAPAIARTQSARCAPVSTAAVEAQFDRFNAAWATKSPDRVTALFATDAVLLPTLSNQPRTDHAKIRDYFVEFLKKAQVGRIDTSTVRLGCNPATRVGTWTVSLADAAGNRSDVKARYSFVYRYAQGRWWIDHLHSSVMPEGQR